MNSNRSLRRRSVLCIPVALALRPPMGLKADEWARGRRTGCRCPQCYPQGRPKISTVLSTGQLPSKHVSSVLVASVTGGRDRLLGSTQTCRQARLVQQLRLFQLGSYIYQPIPSLFPRSRGEATQTRTTFHVKHVRLIGRRKIACFQFPTNPSLRGTPWPRRGRVAPK